MNVTRSITDSKINYGDGTWSYECMSVLLTSVLLFNDLCLQVMAGLQGTPGRGDWKGCKLDIMRSYDSHTAKCEVLPGDMQQRFN